MKNNNTSRLIIKNGGCLIIQPSLASIIGWKEALFLQQIHYWSITKPYKKILLGNVNWVRNSISDWEKNFFVIAKERTIKETMKNLSDLGLILKQQDPTTHICDQTLIYRVNYSKVFELNPEFEAGFGVNFETENNEFDECIVQNSHYEEGADYPMSMKNMDKTKICEASFAGLQQGKTKKPSKEYRINNAIKRVQEKNSKKVSLAEKWKNVDELDLTPAQIWQLGHEEYFDKQIFLTGKESGQLKQAHHKYPTEFHSLVLLALSNWSDFAYNVAIDTAFDFRPPEPHTGYFCKFITVAHRMLENGSKGGFCASQGDIESSFNVPDDFKLD